MIKALDDEEAGLTFQILIFEEIIDPVVPKSSKKYLPKLELVVVVMEEWV